MKLGGTCQHNRPGPQNQHHNGGNGFANFGLTFWWSAEFQASPYGNTFSSRCKHIILNVVRPYYSLLQSSPYLLSHYTRRFGGLLRNYP